MVFKTGGYYGFLAFQLLRRSVGYHRWTERYLFDHSKSSRFRIHSHCQGFSHFGQRYRQFSVSSINDPVDERNTFALPCGNTVSILHDGVECLPAMFEAIDSALHDIRFEMYWFESDRSGTEMSNHLIEASRRGINVRVVYDAFGSANADVEMFEKMRDAGCEVIEFNPLPKWWFPLVSRIDRVTRRDHRKMLVVDNNIAFTGGMNIGDLWLPKKYGGEEWRDIMVRFEGPVVQVFSQIFDRLMKPLRDGHDDRGQIHDGNECIVPKKLVTPSSLFSRFSFSKVKIKVQETVANGRDNFVINLFNQRLIMLPKGTMMLVPFNSQKKVLRPNNSSSNAWWSSQGRLKLMLYGSKGESNVRKFIAPYKWIREKQRKLLTKQLQLHWSVLHSNIQVITNDAFNERNTIRRGYLRAIHSAKKRIMIVNSYFVPCKSICRALYRAAARGVDVRIIVPGVKTDLQSVRFATQALYEQMLFKGIKLYEYLPSVLHAKLCVVDGSVSAIGSYNLDYRSWYHNLEIVTVIHDRRVALSFENRMNRDIEENCEKVELSSWSTRPWIKRVFESFFYFFRRQM